MKSSKEIRVGLVQQALTDSYQDIPVVRAHRIVEALDGAVDPTRLAIFLAALPHSLDRAPGLEPNEDKRRTRAIEDAIRTTDEALVRLCES